MTPFLQQITAAATLPAAMAVETWARMMSQGARQWDAALTRSRSDTPRPEEALTDAQADALDRASEAMEWTAETMEGAAAHLVDDAPTPDDHADAQGPAGDVPDPVAGNADGADLRSIDGTFTAADDVIDAVEPAPEEVPDTAALVEKATGHAPKSLDEMVPTTDRPAL